MHALAARPSAHGGCGVPVISALSCSSRARARTPLHPTFTARMARLGSNSIHPAPALCPLVLCSVFAPSHRPLPCAPPRTPPAFPRSPSRSPLLVSLLLLRPRPRLRSVVPIPRLSFLQNLQRVKTAVVRFVARCPAWCPCSLSLSLLFLFSFGFPSHALCVHSLSLSLFLSFQFSHSFSSALHVYVRFEPKAACVCALAAEKEARSFPLASCTLSTRPLPPVAPVTPAASASSLPPPLPLLL